MTVLDRSIRVLEIRARRERDDAELYAGMPEYQGVYESFLSEAAAFELAAEILTAAKRRGDA